MEYHINYLAVLVSAVVYFIIGAVWYSALFGKIWMKHIAIPEEELRKGAAAAYIVSFISMLVMTFVMAHVIDYAKSTTVWGGILSGFFCWLGFVITTSTTIKMFEHKKIQLHLIDNGYHLVGLLAAGIILSVWH